MTKTKPSQKTHDPQEEITALLKDVSGFMVKGQEESAKNLLHNHIFSLWLSLEERSGRVIEEFKAKLNHGGRKYEILLKSSKIKIKKDCQIKTTSKDPSNTQESS